MLSPDQILAALRRWWVTAAVVFGVVLGSVAVVTFLLPKSYSATAYLQVGSTAHTSSDFEATQVSQVLVRTYAELLQTRSVAAAASRALPFRASTSAVRDAVSVSPVTESQLIRITATASTPDRSQVLANTYARVFVQRANPSSQADATAVVSLAEPATANSAPSQPRPKLYLLVGGVLAVFLAVAAALLRQRFDQRIEIDSSATEILGLPILARVPPIARIRLQAVAHSDQSDPAVARLSDAFRLLLANLAFVNLGQRPRSLAVVSPGEGEGKSTCCMSIGRVAAELDTRVVLVDGDLRRGGLTSIMRRQKAGAEVGFSDLLARTTPLAMGDVVVGESGSDLLLIPSGPLPPNPPVLLGERGLSDFEQRAANLFDLVIFDTPPLSVGPDASFVSAAAGGTILVVDAQKTRRNAVVQAVQQLERIQARVLGVVVNRVEEEGKSGYYQYYYGSKEPSAAPNGDERPLPPAQPTASSRARRPER
jgi:capsular exopolysaccharide synthesis family protein